MGDSEKERSFVAVAATWASRVTSIAMEMVVPPVLGLWIDRRLDTEPVFVLIGTVLGFCTGMLSLFQVARLSSQPKGGKGQDDRDHHRNGGKG